MNYIFEQSLSGLFSCVFEYYLRKDKHVKIISQRDYVPKIISDDIFIYTDEEKARRVWCGLEKKLTEEWMVKIYTVFLADVPFVYQLLFDCIIYFFDTDKNIFTNYGNPHILDLHKMYLKVSHEQHRMKGFVRFQKTKDNIYYAEIEPDHNVLPLLSSHFSKRFADQLWIIYDKKRKYGLYYDLQNVQEIQLNFDAEISSNKQKMLPENMVEDQEAMYETLWKDYFKTVNIKERKNIKLHTQFLPKRYWRYLTEKRL